VPEHALWKPEAIARFHRHIEPMGTPTLLRAVLALDRFKAGNIYENEATCTWYVVLCVLRKRGIVHRRGVWMTEQGSRLA
jgi:hypothetical protein